jgi:hypothetical protein
MHSDSVHHVELEAPAQGVVSRLLDPVFGFLVWIAHLVVIYVGYAVSCGLGLTSGSPRAQTALVIALAAVTIGAAAIVGVHGLRRYREEPRTRNHGFLLKVAVGNDAIAALAILWQLIPIFMTPVCR